MFKHVWYCWNRTHEHSTEQEAEWCAELYEQWQEALGELVQGEMYDLAILQRTAEVEAAVNELFEDDDDQAS